MQHEIRTRGQRLRQRWSCLPLAVTLRENAALCVWSESAPMHQDVVRGPCGCDPQRCVRRDDLSELGQLWRGVVQVAVEVVGCDCPAGPRRERDDRRGRPPDREPPSLHRARRVDVRRRRGGRRPEYAAELLAPSHVRPSQVHEGRGHLPALHEHGDSDRPRQPEQPRAGRRERRPSQRSGRGRGAVGRSGHHDREKHLQPWLLEGHPGPGRRLRCADPQQRVRTSVAVRMRSHPHRRHPGLRRVGTPT